MSLHTFVLIVHVIGSGMIIGVVLISLAITLKKLIKVENLNIINYLHKLGTISAAVMLITGLYLFFSEPEEFATNPIFWIKMSLYICDAAIAGVLFKRKISELEKSKDLSSLGGLSQILLISSVIILLIISLGVILVES